MKARLAFPVAIFLIALFLPFIVNVGGLRLTPARATLVLMILPLIFYWISGRAGAIRLADITLFAFCLWCTLSFVIIHGFEAIEAAGILFIETMGAYLLGRVFIRNADDFHAMVLFLFRIILLLLPFAIIEALTSRALLIEVANAIGNSHAIVQKEPRWGLDRVQGPFEHPILFGVACGTMLTLVYFVLGYGSSWLWRNVKTAFVGLTAALSLSSGPLSALMAQTLLLVYDGVFKKIRPRWIILAVCAFCLTVLIELVANRNSAEIFISYFAFSQATAYNRIHIWTYGFASVLKHPVFGIGFNDWVRPYYMTASIDMFWLVPAVRHGLPAALLLQFSFFSILLGAIFTKLRDPRLAAYRLGFVLCLIGYYVAGWTVHYWNEVYLHFMFILGSGVWMIAPREKKRKASQRRGGFEG
ncbi:hypothetical protein KHP62_19770 [Rhodobacteraceae bacterium NNCM2]|nr:hypothetical protein [Coraliihabitans acroporae]